MLNYTTVDIINLIAILDCLTLGGDTSLYGYICGYTMLNIYLVIYVINLLAILGDMTIKSGAYTS